MTNELSVIEVKTLKACETVIRKGIQTFFEVGDALLEIRSKRLYRQEFITFHDYCQQRWGMTRMRASQLISAAEVVTNVNNCLHAPTHESQVRPLAKLEPEEQREVWKAATKDNPHPTAKRVAEEVENLGYDKDEDGYDTKPQKVYPTDISVETRKPITEIEEIVPGTRPSTEGEDDAMRTLKSMLSCAEELAGLIGDLSEQTGRDLNNALIDVNGVAIAVSSSRAGRAKLLALKWPQPRDWSWTPCKGLAAACERPS